MYEFPSRDCSSSTFGRNGFKACTSYPLPRAPVLYRLLTVFVALFVPVVPAAVMLDIGLRHNAMGEFFITDPEASVPPVIDISYILMYGAVWCAGTQGRPGGLAARSIARGQGSMISNASVHEWMCDTS